MHVFKFHTNLLNILWKMKKPGKTQHFFWAHKGTIKYFPSWAVIVHYKKGFRLRRLTTCPHKYINVSSMNRVSHINEMIPPPHIKYLTIQIHDTHLCSILLSHSLGKVWNFLLYAFFVQSEYFPIQSMVDGKPYTKMTMQEKNTKRKKCDIYVKWRKHKRRPPASHSFHAIFCMWYGGRRDYYDMEIALRYTLCEVKEWKRDEREKRKYGFMVTEKKRYYATCSSGDLHMKSGNGGGSDEFFFT